jgi:hypothetical protein
MIEYARRPAARKSLDATNPLSNDRWFEAGPFRRPILVVILAVIFLVAGAGSPLRAAAGEDNVSISDKFVLSLGTYLTDFETNASVGTGGVFGTFIRAEDDLGLDDDDTLFRVDGFYRFNPRHGLDFGFWTFNRDGAAIIADQIEFDGTLFDVGANVRSEFDSQWLRLGWRYSFFRSDRGEAGISAGLSTYDFEIALEGDATVSDGMGGTTIVQDRAEDDLIAPVPTFGIFINYAITPRVIVKLKADFLDLQIDDLDGKVIDTTFLIEWYFSRHVGVGVGTNGTDIDIRDEGDDPFTIDYSVSGLMAYFTFSFGEVH